MAQAQDLRQAITSVAGRPGPVLTAYLSVNADIPENQGRTYLVRLRDAMNDEGVPEGLQQRVREYIEEETHPEARTLAIFADEDGLFEIYRLQVDVPESFRWGDPYVAPLTLVLDEYEPYGAVVLDAERFRYFVVSPLSSAHGEGEMKANGFREVDVHPSEPYPRGRTDFQPASRRTEREDCRVPSHPAHRATGAGGRRGTRRSRFTRGRTPGPARGRQGARGARAREGTSRRDKGERRSRPRCDRRGPSRGEPCLPPRRRLGAGDRDPLVR